MKINWKVRLRNKYFVVPMATVIITAIYQILMINGIVPAIAEENIMYIFNLIVDAFCAVGILVDSTTPGFSDSQLVMSRGEGIADAARAKVVANENQ